MKNLTILLLLFSPALASSEATEIAGLYLRYEGAEYESAFIPCHKNEVWWLEGGIAYDDLVDKYRASAKNEFGEILVSLRLKVEPTDRAKYPNSHYHASATVMAVAAVSSDVEEIEACRKES